MQTSWEITCATKFLFSGFNFLVFASFLSIFSMMMGPDWVSNWRDVYSAQFRSAHLFRPKRFQGRCNKVKNGTQKKYSNKLTIWMFLRKNAHIGETALSITSEPTFCHSKVVYSPIATYKMLILSKHYFRVILFIKTGPKSLSPSSFLDDSGPFPSHVISYLLKFSF